MIPLVAFHEMGVLQIPDPENEVAIRLHDVVTCLVRADRRAASDQLEPLVGVTRVTHPIVKMPVRARGDWPVGSGTLTRSPPRRIIAMVYVRDSFTCRYCGRWTVPTQILRLISVAFPVEFPFHRNWQRDIAPRAYWDISTSLDHVHAVATGGDYRDPATSPRHAPGASTRSRVCRSKHSAGSSYRRSNREAGAA
jgi:hypothetical protein